MMVKLRRTVASWLYRLARRIDHARTVTVTITADTSKLDAAMREMREATSKTLHTGGMVDVEAHQRALRTQPGERILTRDEL